MFNTPQSPPAPTGDLASAQARPRLTGAQVLLLEEDPETLAILTRTLAAAGYRVTASQVFEHALAVLRCQRPLDLLLCGPELCAVARAQRPDLPCVVITGADQSARMALVPGDVPMLSKPLRRQVLLDQVTSTLRATKRAADMARQLAN
jgi:two-component system, NtrC family, response regulator GlrR